MPRTCTGIHQGCWPCQSCLAVYQLSTHRQPTSTTSLLPPRSRALAFPGRPLSFLIYRCSDRRSHSLAIMMSNMRSLHFPPSLSCTTHGSHITFIAAFILRHFDPGALARARASPLSSPRNARRSAACPRDARRARPAYLLFRSCPAVGFCLVSASRSISLSSSSCCPISACLISSSVF